MKYYSLKLLTQRGPKELIFSEEQDIKEFTNNVIRWYGDFITLSSDEFEHPIIDRIFEMSVEDSIEVKPFMITYNIWKRNEIDFEVVRTDGEINTAVCSIKELMLAIRDNKFSELKWEIR